MNSNIQFKKIGKKSKDEEAEHAVEKEGSDTESTEHQATKSTENQEGKDEANSGKQDDTQVDPEDQKPKKDKVSVTAKMTNLFAAVRKSVKGSKDKYEQSESEVKVCLYSLLSSLMKIENMYVYKNG